MSNSPKRYLELDALRGIAAMIVVLFHYSMVAEVSCERFKFGITGVDLFFMISGFVIALSIHHVSTAREFIINRLSRLYPTYWTAVTFTFCLICLKHLYMGLDINWLDYLGNMTMFQYYLGILDLDGPYWTMIIEMIFYILILLLFVFNLLKYIVPIGSFLCLATVLAARFWEHSKMEYWFTAIPLLQFFPLFFAGILFYKIITKEPKPALNYLLVLGCFVSQILLFKDVGRSRIYINQSEYTVVLSLYFGTFLLFANHWLRWITISPLLFLGKISYALYLIHYYIISRYIIPFFVVHQGWNAWLVLFVIALPSCILIATAITYFVEVPSNKKMRQMLNRF